jgi:hypothetical protein
MARLVRVQARVEASQSGKGEGLMVLAASSAQGRRREGSYSRLRVVGACPADARFFGAK